jgi:toxin ParE1/3/4
MKHIVPIPAFEGIEWKHWAGCVSCLGGWFRILRWTAAAAAPLEHISANLKDRHPHYRQPTIRKLHEAIRSLKESPNRGRLGRVDGTREPLFLPLPYIAVHRVNEQVIEMLCIYHAVQDRP